MNNQLFIPISLRGGGQQSTTVKQQPYCEVQATENVLLKISQHKEQLKKANYVVQKRVEEQKEHGKEGGLKDKKKARNGCKVNKQKGFRNE